jgi:hypothetical protein
MVELVRTDIDGQAPIRPVAMDTREQGASFTQDPPSERDDEAGSFGNTDEFGRLDHNAVAVS